MAWTPLPEVVKVTVKTPKPKEFTLDPAKTAVVVVDMQNTYCHKDEAGRGFAVIEGNVRLLEKARESGAKVIFVQSLRQVESPDHTVFGRPLHLLPGTWDVQIAPELDPQPGEPIMPKYSNSIWSWHGIEELLEQEGIVAGEWTVLVTGISAAACAHAAALGFANRHYMTLIPLDCTSASIEDEARTYYQYMSRGYSYCMDFTLSTMVTFESPVGSVEEKELALAR